MSLGAQSGLILIITLSLFLVVPLILALRGWLLCAGLAMLVIQFLPLVWQAIAVPDSDAPGFGLLLIMTLPISLLVILAGLIASAVKGINAIRRKAHT